MEDTDIRQLKEYILEPFKEIIKMEFQTFKDELEKVRVEHEKHEEDNNMNVQRFEKSVVRLHERDDGLVKENIALKAEIVRLEEKIDAKPAPKPFLQTVKEKGAEYLVVFLYIMIFIQFLPTGIIGQTISIFLKTNGI